MTNLTIILGILIGLIALFLLAPSLLDSLINIETIFD